jgi:hypothetical protein
MTRSPRFSATLGGLCVLLNAVSSRVRCKSAVKGTFADAECWAILRDGVGKFAHGDKTLTVCSAEIAEDRKAAQSAVTGFRPVNAASVDSLLSPSVRFRTLLVP